MPHTKLYSQRQCCRWWLGHKPKVSGNPLAQGDGTSEGTAKTEIFITKQWELIAWSLPLFLFQFKTNRLWKKWPNLRPSTRTEEDSLSYFLKYSGNYHGHSITHWICLLSFHYSLYLLQSCVLWAWKVVQPPLWGFHWIRYFAALPEITKPFMN